jgi:hypothetical protein
VGNKKKAFLKNCGEIFFFKFVGKKKVFFLKKKKANSGGSNRRFARTAAK